MNYHIKSLIPRLKCSTLDLIRLPPLFIIGVGVTTPDPPKTQQTEKKVEKMGKHGHSRSPNDQRSDNKNLNNPASKAAHDNRSNQLNPNNSRYQGKEEGD